MDAPAVGEVTPEKVAQQFTEEEQTFLLDEIRKCKVEGCWGRGSIGTEGGRRVPCKCVKKAIAKILNHRLEMFEGLRPGFPYSLGTYGGVEGGKHIFKTSLIDTLGAPVLKRLEHGDESIPELRHEHRKLL